MGDEMAYKQSDSLEVSTKPVAKSADIYNYLVYSWMSFLIFLVKTFVCMSNHIVKYIQSTVVILIIYKLSVSTFSFLEKNTSLSCGLVCTQELQGALFSFKLRSTQLTPNVFRFQFTFITFYRSIKH